MSNIFTTPQVTPRKSCVVLSRLYDAEALLAARLQQEKSQAEAKQQKLEEKRQRGLKRMAEAEQRKQEYQRKREQTKRKRAELSCKGIGHQLTIPVWRGSVSWLWCSYCDQFGLCSACSKQHSALLAQHEALCQEKQCKSREETSTPEESEAEADERESV
jgi:DNA mismatch repair ATPase MutL